MDVLSKSRETAERMQTNRHRGYFKFRKTTCHPCESESDAIFLEIVRRIIIVLSVNHGGCDTVGILSVIDITKNIRNEIYVSADDTGRGKRQTDLIFNRSSIKISNHYAIYFV